MTRKQFIPLIAFLSLLAFSCGDKSGEENTDSAAIADTDSLVVITGLSEEMSMVFPKELLMREGLDMNYNANFGQMEISAGDGFGILITEEPWTMKEEKENLSNDQLFSYKFETENDSALVFQSLLPDGEPHSYQFVMCRNINGKNFVIRTESMQQFNHRHLTEMEKAVNSLRANS